jgi:hypothetical protein
MTITQTSLYCWERAVLATCGIRPSNEAFENTHSHLLLLADSEEEE